MPEFSREAIRHNRFLMKISVPPAMIWRLIHLLLLQPLHRPKRARKRVASHQQVGSQGFAVAPCPEEQIAVPFRPTKTRGLPSSPCNPLDFPQGIARLLSATLCLSLRDTEDRNIFLPLRTQIA